MMPDLLFKKIDNYINKLIIMKQTSFPINNPQNLEKKPAMPLSRS